MSEKEALALYQEAALPVDLSISREPQVVLAEARKAAEALRDVISKKPDPVMFNGQRYLELEDWTTCARFYGVTAKVRSTNFIQYGDVIGFEASAEAIVMSTGQVISSADAMCLNDEDKWSTRTKYEWQEQADGKKKKVKVGDVAVPLFQLRSMAQTRACAKVLRNVFSWVVVLAGYRPTPAEELNGQREQSQPAEPQTDLVSDAQRKRFFAKVRSANIPDDVVKARLASYHYGSTKEIKKLHYDALCDWADNFGKAIADPEPPPAAEAGQDGGLPF
jgi:hypothetical protein